jgi:large subunit ribosomal protein L22
MVRKKDKMAGINTEKPTGQAEKRKMTPIKKEIKQKITTAPIKKEEKKTEEIKEELKSTETKTTETKIEPSTEKKKEKKAPVKKIKRDMAFVNITDSPVSTKYSIAICKFLKGKKITDAIKDLEKVIVLKKAIAMKGEIAHRKGKMMSGKFPVRASKEFLMMLKSLLGNANQNDMEEPIITEAIANKGTHIQGRMGRKKKRSNIKIICTEKKLIKQKEKKK